MPVWDILIFIALLMLQLLFEFIVMAFVLNYVFKARLIEAVAIAASTIKKELGEFKIDLRPAVRDLCTDADFIATVDDIAGRVSQVAAAQVSAQIESLIAKYMNAAGMSGGDSGDSAKVGGFLKQIMGLFG